MPVQLVNVEELVEFTHNFIHANIKEDKELAQKLLSVIKENHPELFPIYNRVLVSI